MARINGAGMDTTPSARAQLRAIAWLRWRLFVNAFRRKGGKGELIARIVLFPLLSVFAIGPMAGAGFGGYYAVRTHSTTVFSIVTWAVIAAWVFVTSASTLNPASIDLSLLLRFPMKLSSYVLTRFFFGLLATPNVIGSLALTAAAIGVGIAEPGLFPWAALVLFCYALMTILLLRMVLLWLERWLAQRRTREIAGVFFALFFVSFQFINIEAQTWIHQSARHQGHASMYSRLTFLLPVYHAVRPLVAALPPTLAAGSIMGMLRGDTLAATEMLAGLLVYSTVFAALFVLRLRGEFRGENFNEAPKREQPAKAGKIEDERGFRIGLLPAALAACVEKELRYLARGPSLLLNVLTPLVLVGLYASRMHFSELLLPGAMAYTLFSLLPLLYNVLGQDAAGAQLYLLSPTPIRTVFLAKNLVLGLLITLVASGAAALVSYSNAPSAPIAVGTALWFLFVLFTNLSFGNSRSIQSPIKVDMGKIQRRQGASRMSGLIVLGVLFGSLLAGFLILFGCRYLGHIWAAPAMLLAMAVAAMAVYVRTLNRIGRVVQEQRDGLIEVLCKV